MDLPELPRKLNKREAEITPRILEWMQKTCPFDWFIEIKATKNNTIPRSAVKPHQLQALLACKSKKGFKHKISDIGRVKQPFDAFGCKLAHSFVVVCFLKHKVCLAIDPQKWDGANPNTPAEFTLHL